MAGGFVGLFLPDLVAVDASARPVLAADPAAPGDPGGSGGRLGPVRGPGRRCSALVLGLAIATNARLLLDGPGGPERVDGRPDQAPAGRPQDAQPAAGPARRRACPRGPGPSSSARRRSSTWTDRSSTTRSSTTRRSRRSPGAGRPTEVGEELRRAGRDPRLCRLVRDRAVSIAGQLRVHAASSRPSFSPAWSRRASSSRRAVGLRQELYRGGGARRSPDGGSMRMDAMTVVTGGAGFIGSHLVGLLVERGRAGPRGRAAGGGRLAPPGGRRGRPGRHPRPRGDPEAVRGGPVRLPPGGQPQPLGPRPGRVRRGEPPGDGPRPRRRAGRRGGAGRPRQHREHPDPAPGRPARSPRTSRSRSPTRSGPTAGRSSGPRTRRWPGPGPGARSSS